MPKTVTPHHKDTVAQIKVTRSGVQYVEPGYYLDDPDVREEIRGMGKLFHDYVENQGRRVSILGGHLKSTSPQRRRQIVNRFK